MSITRHDPPISDKPRRRRLPPDERRRQIVRAVNQVVAEHGVGAATVARIAATAGVSEGALYVYFASREEMLKAALDDLFGRWLRSSTRLRRRTPCRPCEPSPGATQT